MIYTIENEKIKVNVTDKGAEIQNIILKSDGTEYLWQGNPEFWPGRAYNLFPICGRLYEGKYTYKGKTYEMNLHGFARDNVFDCVKVNDEKLVCTLVPNDEIKAQYPFDFVFEVTYTLDDTSVETGFRVVNKGNDTMIFGLGGHPGFNVPLTEGEKFEDYYVEFDCALPAERLICTPFFYTGKSKIYELRDGKIVDLKHNLFDNDAIFFKNMCKHITLKSKKSDKFVRMEYPKMNYVGLWHKPKTEAPYVCIEPWYSIPSRDGVIDDLETKESVVKLKSGKEYKNGFKITIG